MVVYLGSLGRYYDAPVKNNQSDTGLTRGRAAVLAALRGQPDPVGVEALAVVLGRHPNTLREQLSWLVQRGLVVRVAQPALGRGRPAWLYSARGTRPADDDYVELAAALAWTLEPSEAGREQALEAGRHWGEQLVDARGPAPVPSPEVGRRWTVELMADLGYEPEADETDDLVVLHRCPLLQAAHRFPDVVCTLHLGLVQAALERNGADPARADLRPFAAPHECHLRLHA
jgi:predicted ArsR family transcriptional regulator